MKKAKTLETKLRSALRLIWSRSSERRAILKEIKTVDLKGNPSFVCPVCSNMWPIQMAEVDHINPIGELQLNRLTEWVKALFHSPQWAICKLCHKKKSIEDRRKIRERKKVK